MANAFALRVDDEVDLVLREAWTNAPVAALIERNIERLRPWEPWAQGEPDPASQAEFAARSLQQWTEGRNVPTVICVEGEIVGTMGVPINPYLGTAGIGYWIDAGYERRGIVTRAARALIDYVFARYDVHRIEIHCSVDNARSRAVAERLGFVHEGTLRSAFPVGDVRQDEAVYGLLRPS